LKIDLLHGKKIYFASDFHLGIPNHAQSIVRERIIVQWLHQVSDDAQVIFLLGDVFDFWFEYKYTVPKGHVRLLGKLGELTDRGIKIVAFKGNHDMWMFGYFEKELNIPVISDELILEVGTTTFFLHHGDGLGPGDNSYKLIKKIFRNPLCILLFKALPSRIGIGFANYLSSKSRLGNRKVDEIYNEESEWLLQFCRAKVSSQPFHFYIFGHRHLPLDVEINSESRYINLGEWLHHQTYAVFDGTTLELKKHVAS
jgi:UDP-2,3-diacylglucosamine hydrolase